MAKNQWTNQSGKIVVSETQPFSADEYDQFYPVVNEKRVNKTYATYTSYAGSTEWAKAANKVLYSLALNAFQSR